MEALFELRTLGVPRLFAPGGREVRVRTNKHLALLVYLAVEPAHTARREYLIELLWPDVAPARGRQSLATALSALRARLGRDVIETERDKIRLRVQRLRLDLARLEAGNILGDEHTPRLEVQGFLAGFEVHGAPEFQMWCDRQRARLLPALEHALIVLADHARRTADLTRLAQAADQLLALDELSEQGIRARMEAHALAGDRITAVRIFDEWAERLHAELGAKPSPLLEGMAMRLRLRGLERSRDSAPPTVRTEHWAHRPFVGRAREYRVLYELWEHVASSGPRHCLILGDSGVGKTTLADRLATAVALEGAHVARVRCYELERGVPYATIGGAVELLLDRPGAAATSPQSLAEIGRVVPAVHQRFHNLPPAVEIQGEAARIRFAEAVLDLLTALMDEHPVLLIVDDFPLSDDASLAVLHLLMRRLAERSFMVVLTSRAELPKDAPSAQRIRQGVGYLGMEILNLDPMPREDMESLLDLLVREGHSRPDPMERRVLLRAAAGYPLALELLFQDWLARRAVSVAFSLDAMTPEVVEKPERLYEVVAEPLIRSLDSATRMTLHLAAVLDRRLNDLDLYRLVDQTPSQTIVCLARLVDIRALRDRGTGLEFINPGMRTQAYLTIPSALRRVLHAEVADRLLDREARGDKVPGLEIAWHLIRSGRLTGVARYLVRGAREAIDDGAPHAAELALSSGMNLLQGELREEGQLLLAESLQELGRWQESDKHLAPLSSSSQIEAIAVRAKMMKIRARVRMEQLSDTELHSAIEDLEQLVVTHPDPSVQALALQTAAHACELARDTERSARLRGAAEIINVEHLEPADSIRVALAKTMFAYQERDLPAAEETLREAEALANSSGIRSSLYGYVVSGLGVLSIVRGDYASAIQHFERYYDIARRLDDNQEIKRTAVNLALCWSRLGDVEKQLYWAKRSVAIEPDPSTRSVHLIGLAELGLAQAIAGLRMEARMCAKELSAESQGSAYKWICQAAAFAAADIFWLIAERENALNLGRRGTTGEYSTPQSRASAGSFARWCVVTGLHRDSQPAPTAQVGALQRLLEQRQRLDARDSAEVMCALNLAGMLPRELHKELRTRLDALPAGLLDLFWRLGLRPDLVSE